MSFQIREENKEVRVDITADGTVIVKGDVVAFLNDDGSAGDKNQVFLGDVDASSQQVRNALDKPIGNVDEQQMSCYDIDKRIYVKITEAGEILNGTGKLVATISPFRKKDWKLIIAYLYFVDPALVLSGYFSLVTGVTGKAFSSTKPLMLIIDKNKVLRAKITADGSVTNAEGVLLGFLNEDGSAGDDKEHFLGDITTDCRVLNKASVAIGSLDEANLTLAEAETGKVIAKISSGGELFDEKQQKCGSVDFYTAKKFRMVAGYLFFFDIALIKGCGSSLVVRNAELDEQIRKDELEKKRKEEERKKKVEEESEALRRKMEEDRLKVEQQLKAMAEAQAETLRLKQLIFEQEEKRRMAEEEKRELAEQKKKIEEERIRLFEEAEAEKRKLAVQREEELKLIENARRMAEQEAEAIRFAAEEKARRTADMIRLAAEEEARKLAAEQEVRRLKIEEETRLKAEENARRKALEEEARALAIAEMKKKAAEEEARRAVEEEAWKKEELRKIAEREAAEEETQRIMEEEARKKEEAHRKAEEDARKIAEAEARKKDEARKLAEAEALKKEEARRFAEADARKKLEEETRKKLEEETRKKLEEDARKKEEAHRKAEEDARKVSDTRELFEKENHEEKEHSKIFNEDAERLKREIEINERQKVEEELEASLKSFEAAEETERPRKFNVHVNEDVTTEDNDPPAKRDVSPVRADFDRAAITNAAAAGLAKMMAQHMRPGQSPIKPPIAASSAPPAGAPAGAPAGIPTALSASALPPAGSGATPAGKKPTMIPAGVKVGFDRQNSGSWLSGKPSTSQDEDHSSDQSKPAPQTVNAVAMYDYSHPDQSAREFFSFKAGDIFTILPSERDLQGWKIAVSANGEKGFVPGNYLRYLPNEADQQEPKKEAVLSASSTTNSNPAAQNAAQNGNTKPIKSAQSIKDKEEKKKAGKIKDEKKDKDKKKDGKAKGIFGGGGKKK